MVSVGSSACKKGNQAPEPPPSASVRVEKLAPNVDPALLAELGELTRVCKVDVKESTLNCPQGEQRKLVSEFVSQKRDRGKATATFAAALSDGKPELHAVAANVLYSAFRAPWGLEIKPGTVTAADAGALLTATLKLPKAQAIQALPASVHASMLANRGDALFAAIDELTDAQLRTTAVRYLMTHGRLQAFPKVQELAKSSDLQLALAALESPYNMYNWTPAEQAAVCPWASGFLTDTRAPVAAKAGSLLGNCGGEHVDRLLEVGEKSLKAGDFSSARVGAFRDLCAAHRRARPGGASAEQCDRARKLLESAATTKALDDQARTTALAALAYQWPDDATLKLATKLAKDPSKGVADSAGRTVTRLELRLKARPSASAIAGTATPATPAASSPVKMQKVGPIAPKPTPPAAPADKAATDNPF